MPIICIDIHHAKAFYPRRSVHVACEAHDLDVADWIVRTNTRDVRMECLGVRFCKGLSDACRDWACATGSAGRRPRSLNYSGHLSIEMALVVCAIDGAIAVATHPAVEANVGVPNRSRKDYDSRLGNLS